MTPTVRRSALLSSALGSMLATAATLSALPAQAQVTITDAQTAPVRTSNAGPNGGPADVVIGADTDDDDDDENGSITLDTAGPALILDSDNSLTLAEGSSVTIENVDDATGVELQGGANRSFTSSGTISVVEDFENTDTDDDPFNDGPFAEGTGRTGILVSGASPFQGNITLEQASAIFVEGNNSSAINLANTPVGAGLDGDLVMNGNTGVRGDNSAGVRIGSGVTGDVVHNGLMDIRGVGSSAFDIDADIGGGFRNTGGIGTSGFRADLPNLGFNPNAQFDITSLDAEDLGNAGPGIRVGANIARGIELTSRAAVTDEDGNTVSRASESSIDQFGSAPAILIDGEGTPLAIGTVSPITDPAADGYDADRLFAFINTGDITANGVFDDFDATALSVADATLEGGIRNTGDMEATTVIGSEARPIEGVERGTGLARVVVFGDNAAADAINNSGRIVASASESEAQVFFDPDNLPTPRRVTAVAIDIGAGATLSRIENDNQLIAQVTGRDGEAVVIRDASGTLETLINRRLISAVGTNSDSDGEADASFTRTAMDLSANTTGVSILQESLEDTNPDDGLSPLPPLIFGDVLLGSGDDSVVATAGDIIGDIAFGAGNDTLALDDARFAGAITNADGLDITVSNNAQLGLSGSQPVNITSATFDGTSTFRPTLDGATGTASALIASDGVTFEAGATVAPVFNSLINSEAVASGGSEEYVIAEAANLTVGDIGALNSRDDGSFLFDTSFAQQGDTLVVTVDLRDAAELGLDVTQTGVASSVFDATLQALQVNTELGNEIANIDSAGEFYSAYNQLLPEFAAASRQFVVANTDGAVGAVGNHLDSARRSPDRPGGAWLQEFAYFADRDLAGLSEQYRGEGFGFAAGLDTALGPFHAVGVNVGFASTEIEDVVGVDEPLDVSTFIAGLYAGLQSGNFSLDAYAGTGYNDFEQNRRVFVGDYAGEARGDWGGMHYNASLRAGYDIALSEKFWARPVVSLDYLRLSEDGHTEQGDRGVALFVSERTSELGAVTGLMNFGANFEGARTWIRPSLRVGYRNEFISDPVLTAYQFANITDAVVAQTLSSDFPSSGLLLGFSVAAGSGYSSVGFDFDSDIRDGFIRHTGRIVVRLLF